MKQILLIAGTRPNFIKLAPLYQRLKEEAAIRPLICHTGQHFDFNMSDIFWQNLELPKPDFQLNIKGSGVVDTIGKTLLAINDVILNHSFDLIIVFGDVNATAAGAIAGVQTRIPVMHVESGLRSFDRDMPEEINRIITDHVSDYLMVSEPSGITNLQKEGFDSSRYQLVGNIMIECLLRTQPRWKAMQLPPSIASVYEEHPIVATFHRPENVDNLKNLNRMVEILTTFAKLHRVVFPVHPRTRSKMEFFGQWEGLQQHPNLILTDPLSYFEFLKLISNAGLVITDSGGVQEETSFLNVPCVTFRKNTERPVTVDLGTNKMMSIWSDSYYTEIQEHLHSLRTKKPVSIPMWDDSVSKRILAYIKERIF